MKVYYNKNNAQAFIWQMNLRSLAESNRMDTAELTDQELIGKCQAGDESAFGVLYGRYRLRLFGYVSRLLPGQPDLVEEVFQQTWCKVVRSWKGYDDRQKLLAWLCRIAHNLVMDHFRSMTRRESEPLTDQDAVSTEAGPHQKIVHRELSAALEAAICTLPDSQRRVVELRREGRSFKEIADLENSTLNTVLGRMHYAVQRLRDGLKDYL